MLKINKLAVSRLQNGINLTAPFQLRVNVHAEIFVRRGSRYWVIRDSVGRGEW